MRANRGLRLRLAVAGVAVALPATAAGQNLSFADRLFHEKADCQFCHGVNGDGHGDPRSPGKGSDLRATKLDRQQLIDVIRCGRPGTEMPHFDKYAFDDDSCFGLSAAELGKLLPPQPHSTPLTRREIEALADFIVGDLQGQITRRVMRRPQARASPLHPPADGLKAHHAFELSLRFLAGLVIE